MEQRAARPARLATSTMTDPELAHQDTGVAAATLAQSRLAVKTTRLRLARAQEAVRLTGELLERHDRLMKQRDSALGALDAAVTRFDPPRLRRRIFRDPVVVGETMDFPALWESAVLPVFWAEAEHDALEHVHVLALGAGVGIWSCPVLTDDSAYAVVVSDGLIAGARWGDTGAEWELFGPGDTLTCGGRPSPTVALRVLVPTRVALMFDHTQLLGLDPGPLGRAAGARRAREQYRRRAMAQIRMTEGTCNRVEAVDELALELWGEPAPHQLRGWLVGRELMRSGGEPADT